MNKTLLPASTPFPPPHPPAPPRPASNLQITSTPHAANTTHEQGLHERPGHRE